jgi:hypothetical protein
MKTQILSFLFSLSLLVSYCVLGFSQEITTKSHPEILPVTSSKDTPIPFLKPKSMLPERKPLIMDSLGLLVSRSEMWVITPSDAIPEASPAVGKSPEKSVTQDHPKPVTHSSSYLKLKELPSFKEKNLPKLKTPKWFQYDDNKGIIGPLLFDVLNSKRSPAR